MTPMLAKTFKRQNVDGWLVSEKLDGVRALWTGDKLLSRNGNEFKPPVWFTAALPQGVPLDGELFCGRKQFQKTISVVRKGTDAQWRCLTYCVFDAPSATGGFEARLAHAGSVLAGCPVARVLPHSTVLSTDDLFARFTELVGDGAEGVMLRAPNSPYEPKRSGFLLKLKPEESAEASVIAYEPGTGKFADTLGALVCLWNGKVFKLGTGLSVEERYHPPAIGEHVTFRFQELTDGGVPRFPVFICVRNYEGGKEVAA